VKRKESAKKPKRWLQPRIILIGGIALTLVVLGVRLETFVQNLIAGEAVAKISKATAEDTAPKITDVKVPDTKAPDAAASTAEKPKDEGEKPTAEADVETVETKPSNMPIQDLSAGEMEVLKQLSSRRALLDQREQELQQREGVLLAAELRVDQKVKEMEKLRTQLQSMLGQQKEAQQAQIDSLVKIYEAMKPKEAARILQTLDLSVLLDVMRQMKPAKTAPILAEMDAAKAKDITMTLVKQSELPDTSAAN
jgi:flagellar motility protein MotE (MotC chaperone)